MRTTPGLLVTSLLCGCSPSMPAEPAARAEGFIVDEPPVVVSVRPR